MLRVLILSIALYMGCGGKQQSPDSPTHKALQTVSWKTGLASPDDIGQKGEALFTEAFKVLSHPRCVNCHTEDQRPRQGDVSAPHEPPIFAGESGKGAAGMECSSCHQNQNQLFPASQDQAIPGAPNWHLAPSSMAWLNESPRIVCERLKSKAANGGRSLSDIIHHVSHDALVLWAWDPSHGRQVPPGNAKELKVLLEAWQNAGAPCPKKETPQ